MKKIAFIGLGIMGKSMVRNLMKSGFELNIFARDKSKVEDVIKEGANFYSSIGDCVKDCDVVMTIVGYPSDVEDVYFGTNKIFDNAKQGAYLIDMTTSSPSLAEKLYEIGKEKGYKVMDAPVTGGDTGAKNGTLSILVGGDKQDYDDCLKVFNAMGKNINYQGKAGSGQHTKLANQIMIAGTISGLCEALTYAKSKELNIEVLLNSLATGAAGSKQLDVYGLKIFKEDFNPGFFIKHFIKDMDLAKTESEKSNLSLDVLSKALEHYRKLEKEGYGDLGTQALIKYYENK